MNHIIADAPQPTTGLRAGKPTKPSPNQTGYPGRGQRIVARRAKIRRFRHGRSRSHRALRAPYRKIRTKDEDRTDPTTTNLTAQLDSVHAQLDSIREHIETDTCTHRTLFAGALVGLEGQVRYALDYIRSAHPDDWQMMLDERGGLDPIAYAERNCPDGVIWSQLEGDWLQLADDIETLDGINLFWEGGDLFVTSRSDCEICCEREEVGPEHAARDFLGEYPLEVLARVGTPLTVLITAGGPDIRIERDLSYQGSPELVGRWGSTVISRPHDPDLYQWVMDQLIDPDTYQP